MKPWLPTLVDALDDGPVLALSTVRNLARAAVYDRQGRLLAGGVGSPTLSAEVADEARQLKPGDCLLLAKPTQVTLECLSAEPAPRRFWTLALRSQEGAWASWLLTIPHLESGGMKLVRHFLSAFGPWTTPRLPEELRGQWSLLPLKSGLGRLFVLGDDALALETAALAARTGLTVTWLFTADQTGPDLDEARAVGDFELQPVGGWAELTPRRLEELGLKEGVRLVVTTPDHQSFLEYLHGLRPVYLALSGEAEGEDAPGLFAHPLTTTQKALGLIADMLR